MPQFSIIVPVYNVAPYLEECINSVLMQSFSDFELILIDDGSTDGSGSLCDSFSCEDDRIQVVHQRNRGSSAARNTGIECASGEYILFLDSDDFWINAQVLDSIAERLKESGAQVLSFNYVKFDEVRQYDPYFEGAISMPLNIIDTFRYQIEHDLWIACAWNKAIRQSLFHDGDLRFAEGVTSEDIDWSVRLALKAEKFDYLDSPTVCYRQRESSVSQSISPIKVGNLMDNIDVCAGLIENADSERAELLRTYIAYQYGTALFHLSVLGKSKERMLLRTRAKKKRMLLKWSKNRKVRALDMAVTLGGLDFALLLLKIKRRLR